MSHLRGKGSTSWDTGELLHKLRDEKPECRVCHKPCDPDVEPGVDLLMISVNDLSQLVGMIPVHPGPCKREALDRLRQAQARVRN